MQITARDIREMNFGKKWNGYDPEEVKNFLEMVSSEFEKLVLENNNYKKQIKKLENELEDYREKDKKMDKILLTAQNFAENEKKRVKKEMDLKYQEAELNIKKMIDEAARKKADLEVQIRDLVKRRDAIIKEFERFIEKQEGFLDEMKNEKIIPDYLKNDNNKNNNKDNNDNEKSSTEDKRDEIENKVNDIFKETQSKNKSTSNDIVQEKENIFEDGEKQ